MNCADSTERPLKLPEPVFHCVDIFHHQPDNIDVPSGIPAHEELSGKKEMVIKTVCQHKGNPLVIGMVDND